MFNQSFFRYMFGGPPTAAPLPLATLTTKWH